MQDRSRRFQPRSPIPIEISVRVLQAAIAFLCAFASAHADELLTRIDPARKSELWINPGFLTAHFDSGEDLNGANFGLGAEYRFNSIASGVIGRFYNSDREYSNYAGVIIQPVALGPVRIGVTVAGVDGYSNMNHGGWFPALIPTASWEYKRFGLNVGFIPDYQDRLHGGITLQFKFKLYEQPGE